MAPVTSHPHEDGKGPAFYVVPTSLKFTSSTASPQTFVASTQFEGDIGAVSSDVSVATVNPDATGPLRPLKVPIYDDTTEPTR